VLAAPRISAGGGWQRLAAASLALIFAWSAGSKVVAGRRWARTISDHRLPLPIQRVARVGVPFIEAVVPSLVIVGFPRAAAWWVLLLLIGFSLELIRVRRPQTGAVPCGCFGGRRSVDLRAALARNAAIGAIAAFATNAHGSPRLGWPDMPEPVDILPMVLASVGMAVAGLTAWRASVWVRRAARA
jgi:methylamine utilization protein MauE